MELHFGAARSPGMAAVVTAFAALWTGMIVGMSRLGAPLFFPIVFGLFDVLLLTAALHLWTGTTRVRVSDGALVVVRRILGIGWTSRLDARRVEKIEVSVGMQANQRVFYDLRARASEREAVGCGAGIPDKREAEALARLLERALRADRDPA